MSPYPVAYVFPAGSLDRALAQLLLSLPLFFVNARLVFHILSPSRVSTPTFSCHVSCRLSACTTLPQDAEEKIPQDLKEQLAVILKKNSNPTKRDSEGSQPVSREQAAKKRRAG